jgi:hypothetical protein
VRAWRLDATFDTNNYIESYHNQLKTFYFGRTRNSRVDRIIYILSQVVINDYRQEALQVQFGIKAFHLTKKEKKSKKLAYDIDIDNAIYMIIENDDSKVSISQYQLLYNINLFFYSPLHVTLSLSLISLIPFLMIITVIISRLVPALIMLAYANTSSLSLV